MDNKNKGLNLARKLKVMAERGEQGEAQNAAAKLDQLMKRYSLTMDDIEGEELKDRTFILPKEVDTDFISQVASSVFGRNYSIYGYKYAPQRGYRKYQIEAVSSADFVEFVAKVEYYWEDLQKQLSIFRSAYIQKNHLYRKETEEEAKQRRANYQLSQEDVVRLLALEKMARGITKAEGPQKRLDQ